MRYRRLLRCGFGLAVLTVLGSAFVVWLTAPRIGHVSYWHIRHGMSGEQVEDLLGPPGDHRGWRTVEKLAREDTALDPPEAQVWRGDHGTIIVGYDAGRVNFTRFEEAADQGLLDGLRRWLGLSREAGPYIY